MEEAVIVKKVTLLDVYNELVEVKEKQDNLGRKIDEYNGLRERIDSFDERCVHNLTSPDGLYGRIDNRLKSMEENMNKSKYLDEGKGLKAEQIMKIILYIIAVIGGISGLITLLKLLIQMLQ